MTPEQRERAARMLRDRYELEHAIAPWEQLDAIGRAAFYSEVDAIAAVLDTGLEARVRELKRRVKHHMTPGFAILIGIHELEKQDSGRSGVPRGSSPASAGEPEQAAPDRSGPTIEEQIATVEKWCRDLYAYLKSGWFPDLPTPPGGAP